MDGAGSRIVLEIILIALAVIMEGPEDGVAIIPGLNLGQDEPMRIANPTSGYELWLSGKVDYAVIKRTRITRGCLFLVEPKRLDRQYGFDDSIPEAVSQTIALLKPAQLFCLTNGQYWKFLVLRSEDGVPKYYESGVRSLDKDLASSDKELRQIMALVCEWCRMSMTAITHLRSHHHKNKPPTNQQLQAQQQSTKQRMKRDVIPTRDNRIPTKKNNAAVPSADVIRRAFRYKTASFGCCLHTTPNKVELRLSPKLMNQKQYLIRIVDNKTAMRRSLKDDIVITIPGEGTSPP
ncbi:hypothetical protein VNI00_008011 [Paramarasmius palmivorus]|uniref:Uncharacterized protein n=1 Tax=Paramarasmius palmivorus TaxID=297713 RepID=A0AAW0CYZ2_9AGAR